MQLNKDGWTDRITICDSQDCASIAALRVQNDTNTLLNQTMNASLDLV